MLGASLHLLEFPKSSSLCRFYNKIKIVFKSSKLQKRTGLCGKGALGDPGCAVCWFQHLGLHRGWRRAVLQAPSGKVVRLPTQIERVYPQSGHGHRAWLTVGGLSAAILHLPSGHERFHAERMPPTCRWVVRLLLRGPFLRVRTVTVLLGGTTARVVKSPRRSHNSPESQWNTPAGTVRELRASRTSSAHGYGAVRWDAGLWGPGRQRVTQLCFDQSQLLKCSRACTGCLQEQKFFRTLFWFLSMQIYSIHDSRLIYSFGTKFFHFKRDLTFI